MCACVRVCVCDVTDGGETYSVAEKLFYSAIADFSAMLMADTTDTYKALLRALTKSISMSKTANRQAVWFKFTVTVTELPVN